MVVCRRVGRLGAQTHPNGTGEIGRKIPVARRGCAFKRCVADDISLALYRAYALPRASVLEVSAFTSKASALYKSSKLPDFFFSVRPDRADEMFRSSKPYSSTAVFYSLRSALIPQRQTVACYLILQNSY